MSEYINGIYCEGALIGQGAFGQIYLGQNKQTKQYVAIKKEMANGKTPQLAYEAKVYKFLEGGMGIPKVYYQQSSCTVNIMVMDLLGPSLEDMFNYCYRRFSLKTVLMLGIELLTRLEFIHHRNFIHRDIKPDNFALGLGKRANVIFVLDFGLSKRYRTPGTREHIPCPHWSEVINRYRENKSLTGTPRYASINNHMGREQSRRDDLESLGYVLIYFLRGRLPWQGMTGAVRKQKYQQIMQCKIETSLDELCTGMPVQFKEYMRYCRNLGFDQNPDYRFLRRLFKTALQERGLKNDGVYDWVTLTGRFDDSKLPKHCLNTCGVMLTDLKFPAPREYREVYKEEGYRQKPADAVPAVPGVSTVSAVSAVPGMPGVSAVQTMSGVSAVPGVPGGNPLSSSLPAGKGPYYPPSYSRPDRMRYVAPSMPPTVQQRMQYPPMPMRTMQSYGMPQKTNQSLYKSSRGEQITEPNHCVMYMPVGSGK